MRYLNLLFQGGGVKGIAYAGVLDKLPKDVVVDAVGGTSAGAIAASLVALGVTGTALKQTLSDPELFALLEEHDVARLARLRSVWADLYPIIANLKNQYRVTTAKQLYSLTGKHPEIMADLRSIWDSKGLHSTARLKTWLDRVLMGKRFRDIKTADLRIVASDVGRQEYVIYDRASGPDKLIAEAVLASVSIPIFFEPFTVAADHFVDGGILSNFPSFLFAQAQYPTLGFRFKEFAPPSRIANTLDYLQALLLTMVDSHDKFRARVPNFTAYDIPIPPGVTATKFALTPQDVEHLYASGQLVGQSVDWLKGSSAVKLTSYFDPDPQAALEKSLRNAHELTLRYRNRPELWVDRVHVQSTFTIRIDSDWSTHYERENILEVEGKKPLFVCPFIAVWNRALGYARSLADMSFEYVELFPGGDAVDVLRVPSFNSEDTKGFAVFFIPPVEPGAKRRFRVGFDIPLEFAQTLGKGGEDTMGCSTFQIAGDHVLSLTFQVLVDSHLPKLNFRPVFGVGGERLLKDVAVNGSLYSGREWRIDHVPIRGEVTHMVEVSPVSS